METAKKSAPTILLLLLGTALLSTRPAAAQTSTYSFGAAFQGSILGLFNGVYYDGSGGGYGIAGNACPPSVCVFSSFPTTAYFDASITTQPNLSGGLIVTDTTTASSLLGTKTNVSSFTTSSTFIPNIGSWNVGVGPLPSSPSTTAIAGSANVNTATPVFMPTAGTSGNLALANGTADIFQQPAATLPGFPGISLAGDNTLFTGNLIGGSVTYSTGPTKPPTVQTLGNTTLLQSLGAGTPGKPAPFPIVQTNPDLTKEIFSPLSSLTGTDEFSASVYQTPDQSQTIIALTGGSVINGVPTTAYTVAKALATFSNVPPAVVVSETDQLAQLVKSIHDQYPSTNITITSYSVNGLAAQIVAYYAGLGAVTFNSQGAANLLPAFALDSNITAIAGIGNGSGAIYDYRSAGDQVSLWSPQVGQQITVQNVTNQGPASLLLGLHNIGILVDNVTAEGLNAMHGFFPGSLAPTEQVGNAGDVSLLPQIVFGATGGPANLLTYQALVSLGVQKFFDPPPGWSFSLTEATDSPRFASISLPVDGATVFGWELTYFTDLGMSATEVSNSGVFDFGPGVDRLDFFALDALNDPTMVTDPFLFGLTFDSDGTFNGTLDVSSSPPNPGTSVPEPNSLALLAAALVGLGVLRQWRLAA